MHHPLPEEPCKAARVTTVPKPLTPLTRRPECLGAIDEIVALAWHKRLIAQHRLHTWHILLSITHRDLSLDERVQLIALGRKIRAWPGCGIGFAQWMSKQVRFVDFHHILMQPDATQRALLLETFKELSKNEITCERSVSNSLSRTGWSTLFSGHQAA